MDFYRHLFTGQDGTPITYALVYLASIIFTFQMLVTAYSSSSYMEQFISAETVGLVYSVSAGIAIVLSLLLPRFLRHTGNVSLCITLVALISLSQVIMGLGVNAVTVVLAFVVYLAVTPQVYLNIDIFLETLIGTNEGGTGSARGLILTLMSLAAFLSPLAMGLIVGTEGNLSHVYYTGAVVGLLFIALIVARFRQFVDPIYTTIRVRDMLRDAAKDIDVRTVLIGQFLLQIFYTWAIVYIPLYLATSVGFDWPTISQILAAGLLAFVLFEYPIGLIADRHLGEKEMMAVGFVLLTLSVAAISFMSAYGVLAWMALMFISRVGASLVEVTTESYFFKKVNGDEPNLIGLFRLMRPLANLIGALVGSITLLFLPFNLTFIVLALILMSGVFFTTLLTDTK
jgi:MFS family permease